MFVHFPVRHYRPPLKGDVSTRQYSRLESIGVVKSVIIGAASVKKVRRIQPTVFFEVAAVAWLCSLKIKSSDEEYYFPGKDLYLEAKKDFFLYI